tara:strand:+ start:752 stop:1276 length:525 start_codon:yes stop_codon:yes gene_type:complete
MLVGISGKIGCGKDECGQYLVEHYGFKIIKFATIIKQVAVLMTGESYETQISQDGKQKYLKDWGMTIREFQQRLGTDAVRNGLHNDAWVIATLNSYKPTYNWVVTDTRFENEADKVKDLGGTLIRVNRPNNPFPQSDHPSETSLDSYTFDYTINNDSIISELHLKTAKIMSYLV